MTTLIGDLQSIMGTPFGGEGHAVLIFSRVSRAAFQSGAVIIELHDRIPMPKEAEGRFTVEGLDPGPIRVELEGGTVHGHGWNVDLPEEGEWHLADLMDAQVEWSPVVVGRAESAARDATQSFEKTRDLRDETERFRDETFQKADASLNDAANLVRDEVKDDADRAQTQAGVATEQAGVAAGHAEQAGEDRVQTGADRRQTGEDRAQTGEDREAAEGWAGQSEDAATLAITAAATVTQYVGDGFPEGKVTAPVGAVYTDRQATAGAVRWIKTQGIGNIGWEVEWGDTGWRDVTSLFAPALADTNTGKVFLRRTAENLYIRFRSVRLPSGEGLLTMASLPSEWRPTDRTLTSSVTRQNNATASQAITIDGGGSVWWLSESVLTGSGQVTTTRPEDDIRGIASAPAGSWPTTLPGTPD